MLHLHGFMILLHFLCLQDCNLQEQNAGNQPVNCWIYMLQLLAVPLYSRQHLQVPSARWGICFGHTAQLTIRLMIRLQESRSQVQVPVVFLCFCCMICICVCAHFGRGSGAVTARAVVPLTRGPHGAWAHTSAAQLHVQLLHRISVENVKRCGCFQPK